jgi:Ca-activated chloride channel homolog
MRQMLVLAVVIVVAALAASTLTGQGTGRITGVVQDSGGRPLAGADVELKSDRITGGKRTKTDGAGAFTFADLPAGRYEITATSGQFTVASRSVTLTDRGREALTLVLDRLDERVSAQAPTDPAVSLPPVKEVGAADVAAGLPAATAGRWYRTPGILSGPIPWAPLPNADSYDHVSESTWSDASRSPLSTFSIDVDTASYANIRRLLNSGIQPPKDAVRIEELINYFSYDYPEPRAEHPFSITTALAESPWHRGNRLALIGLQARRIASDRMPPRNLVFLIDVSGSMMAANKLPLVKASLAMLARNLTSRDHVAIVVYAGGAGLVLPPTRGDDTATIVDALNRLEAGGSTNGAGGLRLAYRTARAHFADGGVNRVILATDGDFNVGVTSRGELLDLIERERESGIALSVLGYGFGNLKDSTMEQLADKGNGNYAYIDDLSEARKVLVEEAGGTLVTVAKDVKIQVEFNPAAVSAYRLIGYENRALADRDFNDDRKDAGDLGAGHSVTALYEIVPVGAAIDGPAVDSLRYQAPPSPSTRATSETMWVKVRYKQPDSSSSVRLETAVPTTLAMTPALGFASAVASFGMLLRDSEFKGSASFAEARRTAESFRGADPLGHRAEFIRLVGLAESVSAEPSRERRQTKWIHGVDRD